MARRNASGRTELNTIKGEPISVVFWKREKGGNLDLNGPLVDKIRVTGCRVLGSLQKFAFEMFL